jgi:hypothetical protein
MRGRRLCGGIGGRQSVSHSLELARDRVQRCGVVVGQCSRVSRGHRRPRALYLGGQFGEPVGAGGIAELHRHLQAQHFARGLFVLSGEFGSTEGDFARL